MWDGLISHTAKVGWYNLLRTRLTSNVCLTSLVPNGIAPSFAFPTLTVTTLTRFLLVQPPTDSS